jgi:hypothetical protein
LSNPHFNGGGIDRRAPAEEELQFALAHGHRYANEDDGRAPGRPVRKLTARRTEVDVPAALTSLSGSLAVQNNPKLPTCSATTVLGHLSSPPTSTISGNLKDAWGS